MTATQNIEKEILSLENAYMRAIQQHDTSRVMELTELPCIVTSAGGATKMDEKLMTKMMKEPMYELKSYEMKDITVQPVGDDVALIAYKISQEFILEDKPLKLDTVNSSTWVRRGGQWRCALHTESIQGDPFGRDRKPARG